MERLQTVELACFFVENDFWQYIIKHYGKHFISAYVIEDQVSSMLNAAPVKILTNVVDLEENLHNLEYVSGLQYLNVEIRSPEEPMSCGWDKYREILDQCLNLKAVELTWMDEDYDEITLSEISEPHQNIWQERISYFKARGIRIVDKGEIVGKSEFRCPPNENLEAKLAKEAGVKWKFHFH